MIACDEIIYVMNTASTKKANTVAANMTINHYDKKVRYKIDCYILHTVLFAIIFTIIIIIIIIIIIDNYYYWLSLCKKDTKKN